VTRSCDLEERNEQRSRRKGRSTERVSIRSSTLRALATAAVFLGATFLMLVLSSRIVHAASNPRLVLHVPGGAPLELMEGEGGFVGSFEIVNAGASPLVVSRLAVRGDDDEPRVAPQVTVRFANGESKTSATLPPAGKATVEVAWMPERSSLSKQLFGHVVVTSNDEAAGELAVGIRAHVSRGPAFLTEHVLSLLTFLPLAGALFAFGMHVAGAKNDRLVRIVALAVAALQCVLAAWLSTRFSGEVTRVTGVDGLQFVEHAVWVRALRLEYFVGVDGINVAMVLMTALVGFSGVVASFGRRRDVKTFFAAYFVFLTGLMGAFVAMDLLLFFAFLEVALVASYFLVGALSGVHREASARKLVVVTASGSAMLFVAFVALHVHSDRTFLVDGTVAEHSFSIPELTRVSYAAKSLTFFGLPFVKVVFMLAFVGFATLIPMFPFHTWLPDAYSAGESSVSALVTSSLVGLGAYGMLRVLVSILPEGARWAAGAIVAFGAVNVVYGALCALAQDDLKRMVAYACMSHGGLVLVGIGALTPQGISGALVVAVTHGVTAAMLTLLVGALEERVHTLSLARFGGLASEMPIYGALMLAALLASMGLPGLAGFWGEVLALVGAFPSFRTLSCIVIVGLVLAAASHLTAAQRLLFGAFPERWRRDPYLEPFGGRIPELSFRELASVAPLAVLVVVLGLWPAPLLRMIAGGVRDVSALVSPHGAVQIAHDAHGDARGSVVAEMP
jgi:NADH-quinone oxidoreductase subunit M